MITYLEYILLKRNILSDKKDTFVLAATSIVSALALIVAFVIDLIIGLSE